MKQLSWWASQFCAASDWEMPRGEERMLAYHVFSARKLCAPGTSGCNDLVVAIGGSNLDHVDQLAQTGAEVVVVNPGTGLLKSAALERYANPRVRVFFSPASPDESKEKVLFQLMTRTAKVLVTDDPTIEELQLARKLCCEAWKGSCDQQICVCSGVSFVLGHIGSHLTRAFRTLGISSVTVDNAEFLAIHGYNCTATLEATFASYLLELNLARIKAANPTTCLLLDGVLDARHAALTRRLINKLKAEGIRVAFWYLNDIRRTDVWKAFLPICDVVFHVQPKHFGAVTAGAVAYSEFVPTACSPDVHRPVELTEAERVHFGCDISIAGTPYGNRQAILRSLRGAKVKAWGPGWRPEKCPGVQCHDTNFAPDEYAKIISGTSISLNVNRSGSRSVMLDLSCDIASPRVFEVPACGGFLLSDNSEALGEFFELGTEIASFSSVPELEEVVPQLLNEPELRKIIAQMGRKRALEYHTYEHRAVQMVQALAAST